MTVTDGQPLLDRRVPPAQRRVLLLELLRSMQAMGATCSRVRDVDQRIVQSRTGLFLKHDVHGLRLDSLLDFARLERDAGLIGSYCFMAPDHPLTLPHYDRADQMDAMRAVQELGHEVGVHVDPWFLLHLYCGTPLRSIMTALIDDFRAAGIDVRSGNTHGHSRFKMPDLHGFGTSFDLFEEITRQPDFPTLADVDPETASRLRAEQCSLREFGIDFWADLPMWSAAHGIVVTNFVSDNWLGKRGTVEVLVHDDTVGRYKLADRQPPGSRTAADARVFVPVTVPAASAVPAPGRRHHALQSSALRSELESLASHPTLMLIHPEFYCD